MKGMPCYWTQYNSSISTINGRDSNGFRETYFTEKSVSLKISFDVEKC